MGDAVALCHYGHPLYRRDRVHGSSSVQLENRLNRSAYLRLASDEYSMGTERLLSSTMPVRGYANFLVLLRRNKSSALQSQVSDSSRYHVLRKLPVMGGKCLHSPCFVPCLARRALE